MVQFRENQSQKKTQYWYFISFRDPALNKNLGVCNLWTNSRDKKSALEKAINLGISPGGEALVFPIEGKEGDLDENRLYSGDEIVALGYERI